MHENLCRKLIVELDYSEHAAAQTATDLLRIDHLDIKEAVNRWISYDEAIHEGNYRLEKMLQMAFSGHRYFRLINAANPYYDPVFRLMIPSLDTLCLMRHHRIIL